MGKVADELSRIKEEISKTKTALDEKNKIPRTRPAKVVTIKSLSEMFPEMRAMEAVWILGETEYKLDFELDGDNWSTKIAGQQCEISEECDTSYLVKTTIGSYSVKKEWIKNLKDIMVKVKVDISPETKKLEKLYKRIEELKPELEKEKEEERLEEIEREKEAAEAEIQEKMFLKKMMQMEKWARENIEDEIERRDYLWDVMRDEGGSFYSLPFEAYECIYRKKEKR